MHRFYALSSYTRQRFGERVQKIPLDGDFSCPNRDGTLSLKGCVFCNPKGSGSGMLDRGLTLAEQYAFWHDHHRENHNLSRFFAYLQSYSNTHGPLEKIRDTLEQLRGLPGLAGLGLGTRPDCLDDAKLDLLAEQKERLGLEEVFLELGLQSASDATLAHINRGHDAAAFAAATRAAADRGLNVVAHLIAGLPSPEGVETMDDFIHSVEFVNDLPVHGVKFHNLYVCRGTRMERLFERDEYTPLTQDEYLAQLAEGLMRLKPTTVVHRLNGNPSKGDLVAPDWAGNMRGLHNRVRDHLEKHDVWQGKKNGAEAGPPQWYSPDFKGDLP